VQAAEVRQKALRQRFLIATTVYSVSTANSYPG
jgi:hypothetical protein